MDVTRKTLRIFVDLHLKTVTLAFLRPTFFSDINVNKLAGVYVLVITLRSVYEKKAQT
jgi:hypothetical protein